MARDIRAAGALAGLAVKPGTPLEGYLDVLPDFDTLLVMSVEPGFGGQSFIADVLGKVRTARRLVDAGELALIVEIDGGINADTIEQAAEAGVDMFVAGLRGLRRRRPGQGHRRAARAGRRGDARVSATARPSGAGDGPGPRARLPSVARHDQPQPGRRGGDPRRRRHAGGRGRHLAARGAARGGRRARAGR